MIADAAAEPMERLRHRDADDAKADNTNQQTFEAAQIVAEDARPERYIVAVLVLHIGPGQAPPQQGRGRHGVFRDGIIAEHIGYGDLELHQRRLVKPVETGTGDLHKLELRASE